MGLLDCASGKSLWRGMEHYEKRMVIAVCKAEENKYIGIVKGSKDIEYDIVLDIAHPKKVKLHLAVCGRQASYLQAYGRFIFYNISE